MNELISQEKQYKIINQVLEFLDSDKPINDISEYLEDEIRNINKNFKDIGLKDINGKNIYADSSIVEMNRGFDMFTGYYTYNVKKLHYEFIVLDGCDNDSFGNCIGSSIKIIDTIQENKLGLIK